MRLNRDNREKESSPPEGRGSLSSLRSVTNVPDEPVWPLPVAETRTLFAFAYYRGKSKDTRVSWIAMRRTESTLPPLPFPKLSYSVAALRELHTTREFHSTIATTIDYRARFSAGPPRFMQQVMPQYSGEYIRDESGNRSRRRIADTFLRYLSGVKINRQQRGRR